jgi:hypothetical protein
MNIDLELDEMCDIIEMLEAKVEDGDNYRANALLKALKITRAESIKQLQSSLESYA